MSSATMSSHAEAGAGATHQLVKTQAQGRAPLIAPSQTHPAGRLEDSGEMLDICLTCMQDTLLPLLVISGWTFERLPVH